MRGKLFVRVCMWLLLRIIPAHAGQTRLSNKPPNVVADHPRACGANLSTFITPLRASGSSPRMRGKRVVGLHDTVRIRIIPAHAGQTPSWGPPEPVWTDHPRACGANPTSSTFPLISCGSSPRMRGKPHHEVHIQVQFRIIPAHAGQTRRHIAHDRAEPDHPRACGANSPILCENS